MFYYNVIPLKRLGSNVQFLLYSSQVEHRIGEVVSVNVRNNVILGLVITREGESQGFFEQFDVSKVKEINESEGLLFNDSQLKYLELIANNTFNSIATTAQSMFQGYTLLNQKNKKRLQEYYNDKITKDKITNYESIEKNTVILREPKNPPVILNSFQDLENLEQKENQLQSLDKTKSQTNNQNNSNQNFSTQDNPQPQEQSTTKINGFDNLPKTSPKQARIEFELVNDYLVRIMYIIRSVISECNNTPKSLKQSQNKTILVIFPELKTVNYYYELINKQLLTDFESSVETSAKSTKTTSKSLSKDILDYVPENTPPNKIIKQNSKKLFDNINQSLLQNINLAVFSSTKSKSAQSVILDIITNDKLNIILGSKSALFLPFQSLEQIILIDEANTFYIQEQNSMYYDARDVVFLLSKAYNANLNFISKVASIRLHNFYSKELIGQYMTKYQDIHSTPPIIKITKNSARHSNFELFGYDVEKLLPRKD